MSVDFYLGRDELLLVPSCVIQPVVLDLEKYCERSLDEQELIPTGN
jgi:hypothetical protein